jgi:hypothetical protein
MKIIKWFDDANRDNLILILNDVVIRYQWFHDSDDGY